MDRHEENQRRVASYEELPYCYRNADGLIRVATEEDFRNTLEADGFEPYDMTDDEIKEYGKYLPFFLRRTEQQRGNE